MPRCIVCDKCSETDGGNPQEYRWNPLSLGYECKDCRYYTFEGHFFKDTLEKVTGEVPILDDDMEEFEVFLKPGMGNHEDSSED